MTTAITVDSTTTTGRAPAKDVALRVEDLHVYYETAAGDVKAVNGVSFDLKAGERLALVGESSFSDTPAHSLSTWRALRSARSFPPGNPLPLSIGSVPTRKVETCWPGSSMPRPIRLELVSWLEL